MWFKANKQKKRALIETSKSSFLKKETSKSSKLKLNNSNYTLESIKLDCLREELNYCKSLFALIGPCDGSEIADGARILSEAARRAHPVIRREEIRSNRRKLGSGPAVMRRSLI